jgi:hypothetical protein
MVFYTWYRDTTTNPRIVNIIENFQRKKFAGRTQARRLVLIKQENHKTTFLM